MRISSIDRYDYEALIHSYSITVSFTGMMSLVSAVSDSSSVPVHGPYVTISEIDYRMEHNC